METVEQIDPTKEALCQYFGVDELYLEWYAFDARIGWDSYIVTDKHGVLGFTDGPLTNKDQ